MPVLSATGVNIVEGDSFSQNVTFTLTLDAPATAPVTVRYHLQDGSASGNGGDYSQTDSTVTFSVGQQTRTITVSVNGDTIDENNETFFLVLTELQGATFAGGAVALQATATIFDNDGQAPNGSAGPGAPAVGITGPASASPNLPTVRISDVAHFEGNSFSDWMYFLVTLDRAPTAPVTFTYHVQDGTARAGGDTSDGTATVTIPAGETSTWIRVSVNGDTAQEANETIQVVLTDIVGGVFEGNAPALAATGTIINDDGPGAPTLIGGIGAPGVAIDGPASASQTLPTVTIREAAINEGDSFSEFIYFLVTLDRAPTAPVTFRYHTQDGTAGDQIGDYDDVAGTVTIAAGQTSTWIRVNVNGDIAIEGDETFELVLTDITGAVFAGNAAMLSATGTIIDNDSGSRTAGGIGDEALQLFGPDSASATLPTLDVNGFRYIEGNSFSDTGTFTITLDRAPTAPVTFSWYLQDGTASSARGDYTGGSGSFTIDPGQTSATFSVSIDGDTAIEGNETFQLVLTDIDGAVFAGGAAALAATATIIDDDSGATLSVPGGIGPAADQIFGGPSASATLPTISIRDSSFIEGNSFSSSMYFLVTLDRAPTAPVSFQYYLQTGSADVNFADVSNDTGTITFAAGQTSGWVRVTVNGDTLIEGNETFSVVLTNPQGAVFDGGAPALVATGTILDDDSGATTGLLGGIGQIGGQIMGPADASATLPTLQISNVTLIEGNTSARFLITFDEPTPAPVTFSAAAMDLTASGGQPDFSDSVNTITIPAGVRSTWVSISVDADTAIESNETFQLVLSNLTGAAFTGNAPAVVATGTILDNDSGPLTGVGGIGDPALEVTPPADGTLPVIRVVTTTVNEGNASTNQAFVYLVLSRPSPTPITFQVQTQDGTATSADYGGFTFSTNATIPAGQTSAWISFPIFADTLIEGDHNFVLNLTNLTNAAFENGGVNASVTVTIRDDDGTGTAGQPSGPAFTFDAPGPGNDLFGGTFGADVLRGYAGNDIIFGGEGDDEIIGGAGGDQIVGGPGQDRASYRDARAGVNAFLATPASNTGDAAGDTYAEVELLMGSSFSDTLGGTAIADGIEGLNGADLIFGFGGDDFLFGGSGDDVLNGGVGADYMDGQSGSDFASYANAADGVTIFLAGSFLNTGEGVGDIYIGIENLEGSAFADLMGGDNGNNIIRGLAGNDWLIGAGGDDTLIGGDGNEILDGGAGADVLIGGAGDDVAMYVSSPTGLTVNMLNWNESTGEAFGDSYYEVENVWTSSFNDTIVHGNFGGQVYGFDGDDILIGNGGDDNFYGGRGADVMTFGAGADTIFYLRWDPGNFEGGDTITDFQTGVDRIFVSRFFFGFGAIPGPAAALTSANAGFYTGGATPTDTRPSFIYNQATGELFYDADGNGIFGAPLLMATLAPGTVLALGDIWTA